MLLILASLMYSVGSSEMRKVSLRTPLIPAHCTLAMFAPVAVVANLASEVLMIFASPAQRPLGSVASHRRFYDVQVRTRSLANDFYVLMNCLAS